MEQKIEIIKKINILWHAMKRKFIMIVFFARVLHILHIVPPFQALQSNVLLLVETNISSLALNKHETSVYLDMILCDAERMIVLCIYGFGRLRRMEINRDERSSRLFAGFFMRILMDDSNDGIKRITNVVSFTYIHFIIDLISTILSYSPFNPLSQSKNRPVQI